LAAILLMVVALGLTFGVPLYRQQTIVNRVELLRGKVERRYPGRGWLARSFGNAGIELLGDVVAVDLTGSNVGDADLALLNNLPHLELLTLTDTKITDHGLDHLAGMTNLRALVLTSTWITDAGIAKLESMPQLEGLGLIDTGVTDASLHRV